MTKVLPGQRSLKKLRDEGWLCQTVEKYNSFIHIRQDLFQFIDIIAVKKGRTLAIQTTSDDGGNVSAHIKKIKGLADYEIVKSAGWEIECWGWRKGGKQGKRKLWVCRIVKL